MSGDQTAVPPGMRPNALKRVLKRRQRTPLICGVHESRDPGVVFALARGGAEGVLIDLEHQATSLETTSSLVAFAYAARATPVVRIPQHDLASINRILDTGCQSLMIPGIKTRDQFDRVLNAARYKPHGERGMYFSGNANVGYVEEPADVGATTEWLNDNLSIGIVIEHKEAVENLEELLLPEDVDWALVGMFDLSQSYGVIGEQWTSPVIAEAIAKVRRLCGERGIAYGAFAGRAEQIPRLVEDGADLILMVGVLDFVRRGAAEAAAAIAGE